MIRTILLLSGLLYTTLIVGQKEHEISAFFGGGMSSLRYNISYSGDVNPKFGGLFGVGYTYRINSEWGVVSGLESARYLTDVSIGVLNDQYFTQDNYENDFEWRLAFNGLNEKQTGTYLNIPLLVQFSPKGIAPFFTSLGFKVGIPLSGKFDAKYSSLVTSGYYPETGAHYTDIDFRGFGDFEGSTSRGDLNFKMAFMVSAECGLKWNVSNSGNLYIGGYIDYGLNNILKATDLQSRIVLYNNSDPTNMEYKGLMNSRFATESGAEPFAEKVVPMAFGLRVRLGFSLHKRQD